MGLILLDIRKSDTYMHAFVNLIRWNMFYKMFIECQLQYSILLNNYIKSMLELFEKMIELH